VTFKPVTENSLSLLVEVAGIAKRFHKLTEMGITQ